MERAVPAPVEAPTGTWSIWKPKDVEFTLAGDFAAIAAAVGKPIDEVVWVGTESVVNNDIDGHVLSGHA
jgi:hypothetical protein